MKNNISFVKMFYNSVFYMFYLAVMTQINFSRKKTTETVNLFKIFINY